MSLMSLDDMMSCQGFSFFVFKIYLILKFTFIHFSSLLLPYWSFAYILWLPAYCFYGIPECTNDCSCIYTCLLSFFFALLLLFVLSYSNDMLGFFYLILLLSLRSLFVF